MHIKGRGAGEQRDVSVGNAVGSAEFVEGEDGVIGEIDSRGIFELNLRAALAGDETVAGFERQIGYGLLPTGGILALLVQLLVGEFAARDAHIALDVAEADNLGIGGRGVWQATAQRRQLRAVAGWIAVSSPERTRIGRVRMSRN